MNSMYKIRSNETSIFEHKESNYSLKSSWYSEAKIIGVKVLAMVGARASLHCLEASGNFCVCFTVNTEMLNA